MLRLMLLRHFKSDWADPGLKDFDRPLNNRGVTAARAMCAHFQSERIRPNRILCSTALRTRQSLGGLLPALRLELDIQMLDSLYDQSEDSYLPQIRRLGGEAETLLVIGHNPATEDTAHLLFGSGPADLRKDIEEKYPSGGLACFDCPIERWSDLEDGSARLTAFIKPRNLPDRAD